MKLLIYSHFFAPSIGGVENVVQSLAAGLASLQTHDADQEFEVTVVTQTDAGKSDEAAYPFHIVRRPGLFQLWRIICDCDVIHLAGPALFQLFLGLLARKPIVLEHHGYQAVCPNGLLVHQPDGAVCPGHFQARRYHECWHCQKAELSPLRACVSMLFMFPRYWLSRRAASNLAITHHVLERQALPRSSVIHYGVGDLIESSIASAPHPVPRKLSFAYVGRFVPEKGIAVLLNASALLSKDGHEFEVLLIGDGPQRPEIESRIRRYALDSLVRITGYLGGEALAQVLRNVHAVIMPSVWEETAGLAVIEHMMRGRLVIASKIGGLAEVVDDAALTFPPGDSQALADVMKTVLQNPSIIEVFGRKARDRALRFFRRERMIEDHARVYRELLRTE